MRVLNSILPPMETTLMVRDYCGSHIYRDGMLERINNDYGYWADGNWYYYVKDYQGNVRAVISHAGTLKEVNNYYPYGGLMGGGTLGSNASVQPYKYGGKELDRQNGLDWYDSQARMYDPLLGRTPAMDPLAEKYYSISPYAWCGSNPIYRIDTSGNNFYSVNSIGHFNLIKETDDETDRLFSMNGNSVDYNNYIDVSKSFFSSEQSQNIKISSSYNGIENVTIHIYSSDDAQKVYSFLKDNTEVEWSYAKTSSSQFLGTSHFESYDGSQLYIARTIYSQGEEASEFRHFHTNLSLVVSEGDVVVAKDISKMHPNACFYIDRPFTNEFKQYTPSTEPGLLEELIVTPLNIIIDNKDEIKIY